MRCTSIDIVIVFGRVLRTYTTSSNFIFVYGFIPGRLIRHKQNNLRHCFHRARTHMCMHWLHASHTHCVFIWLQYLVSTRKSIFYRLFLFRSFDRARSHRVLNFSKILATRTIHIHSATTTDEK